MFNCTNRSPNIQESTSHHDVTKKVLTSTFETNTRTICTSIYTEGIPSLVIAVYTSSGLIKKKGSIYLCIHHSLLTDADKNNFSLDFPVRGAGFN